jgi:hypothetical protein
VNERLEQRAADQPGVSRTFDIVCECADEECTARIEITFSRYEEVRANAKAFIVVPGHVDRSVERVLLSTDTYRVVEKGGEAGDVAEFGDPREG